MASLHGYIDPKEKINGEVCMWVDMQRVNKAIICECFTTPIIDDLIHILTLKPANAKKLALY